MPATIAGPCRRSEPALRFPRGDPRTDSQKRVPHMPRTSPAPTPTRRISLRTSGVLLLSLGALVAVLACASQEGDAKPQAEKPMGQPANPYGELAQPVVQQPMAQPVKRFNEIVQTFPTNDAMRTAWKVRWATAAKSGNGLYIEEAWYKKTPNDDWLQVLGDARVA